MITPTPTGPRKVSSTLEMYGAMVGVGVTCGLLIALVYDGTKPTIDRKKTEALQRAIFKVLPAAKSSRAFEALPDETFASLEEGKAKHAVAYAGYDEQEKLQGLAIEASGMGYADTIRILYGYDFEKNAITGIQVLESKETPGIGDKIEKDPAFLKNFKRLDVTLTTDGSVPKNAIVAVKNGKKTDPWQIDGITGATISSKAIAHMLAKSTQNWVPKIEKNQAIFTEEHP